MANPYLLLRSRERRSKTSEAIYIYSSEPGPEDEDVAQELCHVEADDEDNDGLVEGGLSVVHDLRDLRYGVSHGWTRKK